MSLDKTPPEMCRMNPGMSFLGVRAVRAVELRCNRGSDSAKHCLHLAPLGFVSGSPSAGSDWLGREVPLASSSLANCGHSMATTHRPEADAQSRLKWPGFITRHRCELAAERCHLDGSFMMACDPARYPRTELAARSRSLLACVIGRRSVTDQHADGVKRFDVLANDSEARNERARQQDTGDPP